MPGFDGRGPRGFGPGRRLGPCRNFRNNGNFSVNDSQDLLSEMNRLKDEITYLKDQIKNLKDK